MLVFSSVWRMFPSSSHRREFFIRRQSICYWVLWRKSSGGRRVTHAAMIHLWRVVLPGDCENSIERFSSANVSETEWWTMEKDTDRNSIRGHWKGTELHRWRLDWNRGRTSVDTNPYDVSPRDEQSTVTRWRYESQFCIPDENDSNYSGSESVFE